MKERINSIHADSPEKRWGHSGKPLHYTGEIKTPELIPNLIPYDMVALKDLVKMFDQISAKYDTTADVLVVGSVANLSHARTNNSDVDLLVCFKKEELRGTIAEEFELKLLDSKNYSVITKGRIGSAPSAIDKLYTNKKLFVVEIGNLPEPRSLIDITFRGVNAGSVELELDFMRRHKLAFCLLDFSS